VRKSLSTNFKLIEESVYEGKKSKRFDFCFGAGECVFLLSGFDYSRHSIPLDDISDGGRGKDGIFSIDNPPNWGAWKKKHHHTRVLSDQTRFQRSYDRNTYQGYESSSRLMFDVNLKD
jgi:hypothetical protein